MHSDTCITLIAQNIGFLANSACPNGRSITGTYCARGRQVPRIGGSCPSRESR